MSNINEKMTALADEVRELSGTSNKLSLDAMANNINEANIEIVSQSNLLAQITSALSGKALPEGDPESTGGIDTSDATATGSDILSGKTAYAKGVKITGTIATKTSSNVSVSGATVTIPAGYYASQVQKSVATVTQATPGIAVSDSGLITASTTQSAGYVSSGTKTATQQLTTQSEKTITPSTTAQTAVAKGVYTTGIVSVAGDSNLIAGNIKSGVSIFGVNGNYEGDGIDTSDATATASDILSGKTAYVNGTKITGSIAFQAAKTITPSTTDQIVVSAGYYTNGDITVKGDINLSAENIKSGVSIFGITGTLTTEGGGSGEQDYTGEDNLIKEATANYTNDRVTYVGRGAFAFARNLRTVDIPNAVRVSSSAFFNAVSMTSANLPACSSIQTYAFASCNSLATLNMPLCESIQAYAFQYCGKLTNVNMPICKYISNYGFFYCSTLAEATFGSPLIGTNAFQSCYFLSALKLTGSTVCTLSNSNAFNSTPLKGYSSKYSGAAYIYVPASLIDSYKTATNWTYYSSRFSTIESLG